MIPQISWHQELLATDASPKILLLLSGGKDSICCLYTIAKMGKYEKFECVTFIHRWSSAISLAEAEAHCLLLGIKLHIIDYTTELQQALAGFKNGRPCLKCKPEMYKKAITLAVNNGFNWLCTGDNANDRTTYNRLLNYNDEKNDRRFFCSRYFAGEQGIELPDDISIVRPLLYSSSEDIELMLQKMNVSVKRNCSTGDKYFEYSREGCALQFCDPGSELTESLKNDLFLYNKIANSYGRRHNIRTSVHLPTTFIVTIPEGYENAVADELCSHGLPVNRDINTIELRYNYISAIIENANGCSDAETLQFLIKRMLERLEIPSESLTVCGLTVTLSLPQIYVCASATAEGSLFIVIRGKKDVQLKENALQHLFTEIFHTRAIKILRTDS